MDEPDTKKYATGVAAAIRVVGPRLRADALAWLRALRLSEEEAVAVIAYGVAERLLDAESDLLRAGPALNR